MKITAKRQLLGDYGKVNAGDTFETSDTIARSLISRGLADAVSEKSEPAPKNKAEAQPQNKSEPAPTARTSAAKAKGK